MAKRTMLLNVTKMTCQHCVRAVTQAVQAIDPSACVEVNLGDGSVRVDSGVDGAAVVKAIEDEGYAVTVVEA